MMKREELSRIASVKFQKALSDRARAVTPRVLAFCVMAVSLVFTLAVTAANLRLTYVTDSDGARQLVVSSETDPARVMSLSGIEAEEGDHVYYTAFSGNLATLNIERAFTVNIQADGQEYPVKMAFGTVAEALERAGITLEADDYTEPALDQLVTVGSEITVHRWTTRTRWRPRPSPTTPSMSTPACTSATPPGHHPAAWRGGSADRDHPREVCGRRAGKQHGSGCDHHGGTH